MRRAIMWLVVAAVGFAPLAAAAAAGCRVGPITGLLGANGATVRLRVSDHTPACGAALWVQPGVIPFTTLQELRRPQHGDLDLTDPTQFRYSPSPGYRGRDSFEIQALGNNAAGAEVTGLLHVNVTVTR